MAYALKRTAFVPTRVYLQRVSSRACQWFSGGRGDLLKTLSTGDCFVTNVPRNDIRAVKTDPNIGENYVDMDR